MHHRLAYLFLADAKGNVAKAKAKTSSADAKKCAETPDFGRAAVGQINTATGDHRCCSRQDGS
jgi:hypothetical protein